MKSGKGFSVVERKKEDRSDTWLTPLEYIKPLGSFDLDPCGFWNHKTASDCYELDMGENGLELPWVGRVWLNPPYSDVKTWLEKLHIHSQMGGPVSLWSLQGLTHVGRKNI